jgi:hypothetical protein
MFYFHFSKHRAPAVPFLKGARKNKEIAKIRYKTKFTLSTSEIKSVGSETEEATADHPTLSTSFKTEAQFPEVIVVNSSLYYTRKYLMQIRYLMFFSGPVCLNTSSVLLVYILFHF